MSKMMIEYQCTSDTPCEWNESGNCTAPFKCKKKKAIPYIPEQEYECTLGNYRDSCFFANTKGTCAEQGCEFWQPKKPEPQCFYVAKALHKTWVVSIRDNETGEESFMPLKLTWAKGMIGVLPVFETEGAARMYRNTDPIVVETLEEACNG